jgi:hypothetical protein
MAAWAVGVDGLPGGGPPPVMDMKALSLAMAVSVVRHTRGSWWRGVVEGEKLAGEEAVMGLDAGNGGVSQVRSYLASAEREE